ncbi:hypothetical protein HanRHA438_Chr14g0658261 [Helianthus annuus]|uniref:WEB family n=1 Tax=Helianthus annuus TaxID=4232 RepID=A0A9K3EAP7_HELAN|nr:hypothetical protein HanXRQr2_Chr14g0647681 [Helianthus annuus]KAJ0468946.1 hypothetical protein HanIR_Chr14g0702461 [Helianthus annuus]KAJ0660161.1 hypothetical protein HanOQP8_Chr14g0534601 [Helianthus annuus]KAJ0854051.1 hypothetical protein HanRHA438_Chr14g0658261 [Helianthus annuus]
MTQKQISDLEEELKKRDASIERFTKQIRDLENELEKTKQSESQMLESLMFQTQQIEQTKMDLEESKQDVIALQEKLDNLQAGGRNGFDRRGDMDSSSNTKALRDEIAMLRKEVRIAQEAEERSKKAMDDLASALSEVAMESSSASEKLRLSEEQAAHLKKEIERLHEELELQTETAERIRVESEEHVLAWTAKEMGFISCIKKADEDIASLKHDNHRLNEALVAAENTTRIAREEAFKLRDHVKQALNESSVAKEAATIAQAENTELKDLLAEKEESVHFLTKENERLRINEVAARENVKEFKRLLAAKAEANKFYEEHTDVFNSPDSMLYEDHLDGRNTPRQMFHFDFSEFKAFNKEDEDMMFYHEDDNVTEIVVDDDPEKAEALKGSIFDTSVSPTSEPHTPESKGQQKAATGFEDLGGSSQLEEEEHSVHGGTSGHHHHHHHTEDGDDKGSYMYGLYNRKKLFRKIGELIVGKNEAKKEGSTEQGKEQAKEQGKEQAKEDGKEHAKEQGKEQAKEHGKEQGKEHAKEKEKEKGKEPGKEKGKEQAKEQGKEDVKEQAKEHGKEEGKGQVN